MKNFTFYLIFALIFLSATVSAQWQQLGNTINDPDWTQLGDAVEISNSGDVIVVGEPAGNIPLYTGQIEVFRLQNSTWTVIGSPITGVNTDDGFGYAVACNHDATIVAGGAPYSDVNGANSGQVQVFKFESGSWSQMGADLNGETASDKYGYAVSLSDDGNILAVGARECSNTNGAQAGRVYVYEYSGSDWVLKGTVIEGEDAGAQFGWSLSFSADGARLAIGAPTYDDGASLNTGNVKVYEFSGGDWQLLGNSMIGGDYGDEFGTSVNINSAGDLVAVGSIDNSDIEMEAGMVGVFRLESGSWNQVGSNIYGETENEGFGYTVSLDSLGATLAVGSELMSSSASVRIFENQSDSWVETDSVGGNVCSLNNPGTVAITGASLGGQGTVRVFTTESTSSVYSVKTSDVKVYPNPTRDLVNISLESDAYVSVLDLQGNIITEQKVQQNATLSTASLKDGIYLLKIQTGNKIQTSRIVVLH